MKTVKPPISILSREFKYTSADHTDIRKTFAKYRASNVTPIPTQRRSTGRAS